MEIGPWAREALRWLWPQTCAHCREDLLCDDPGPLCPRCRPRLRPSEPPFCLRCAEPLAGTRLLCTACVRRVPSCRLIRAAFLYRGPAVSLVHAFKYRGRRSAARAAGVELALAWPRFPELARPDALVPVPLHPRRLAERGYNQALLIARALAERSGLPVEEPLLRLRATDPQWALGKRRRLENLRGAFSAPGECRGKRLLLVDDVCTSGASLEACARALREAGAACVDGYVFARQPAGEGAT